MQQSSKLVEIFIRIFVRMLVYNNVWMSFFISFKNLYKYIICIPWIFVNLDVEKVCVQINRNRISKSQKEDKTYDKHSIYKNEKFHKIIAK
jgi:hypothetical protein